MVDYNAIVERIRTSYHEAAHAVVAELRGRDVLVASIRPRGFSRGRVVHCRRGHVTPEAVAVMVAAAEAVLDADPGDAFTTVNDDYCDPVVTLAGMAAELIHLGDADDVGASQDRYEVVRTMLLRDRTPPEILPNAFAAAFDEATEVVSQSWPAIERVARALRDNGELSGDAVRRLI